MNTTSQIDLFYLFYSLMSSHVSEEVEKDAMQFGKLLLKSVLVYNPDLIITASNLRKYSLLDKSKFANLLIFRLDVLLSL